MSFVGRFVSFRSVLYRRFHVCLCRKMLFCTLTNRYVSMEPVEVRGHIDGKRYKKALEECKSRLQEAVLSAPFESPPARLGI